MSYVALLTIMIIAAIAGLLDGVAEQEPTGFSASDEAQFNQIVGGASIASVDDADLSGNPVNTEVATPGVADREWWSTLWEILSWDLSFLIGPMQIVRTFMMMITAALSMWAAFNIGSSLFGLIRNAG